MILALSTNATAQTLRNIEPMQKLCGTDAEVYEYLSRYDMRGHFLGFANEANPPIALFLREDSQEWALAIHPPEGGVCIFAFGERSVVLPDGVTADALANDERDEFSGLRGKPE